MSSPPVPVLPFMPLGRVSTVDALVTALKQEIFAGHLPGGAPLREAELCARYGVSRHSLRTALQALVQSGLAAREPNRSVLVSTLTSSAVDDIYSMRSLIELEAVALLADRPELRGPARVALARLEALSPDAGWGAVRDCDLAFHAALVEGTGRPRAAAVLASLMDELRLAFLQIQGELERLDDVVRQHRTMLELIESGDREAASSWMRGHLDDARATISAAVSRP